MADNELLPVTQADREAAAAMLRELGCFFGDTEKHARAIEAGDEDSCIEAQAFARHRLATADNAELVGALEPGAGWLEIAEHGPPEPEVIVLCWDGLETFVEWFGSKPDAGKGVSHWKPYSSPPGCFHDMHDGRRAKGKTDAG